jgi:hypothetical protein
MDDTLHKRLLSLEARLDCLERELAAHKDHMGHRGTLERLDHVANSIAIARPRSEYAVCNNCGDHIRFDVPAGSWKHDSGDQHCPD